MQQIDPINRMIRENSYNLMDGVRIDEQPNLFFFQPSTNYEEFLGKMQPITREFINMNVNSVNWIQAGRRFAFPLFTVGYPQNTNNLDSDGNDYNPMKSQAEDVLMNADPSNGLAYPYTLDRDGNIIKALDIQFEGGNKGGVGAHKIYSDFNETKKDEIREMIFGGTLTSSSAKYGTKGLGEVHMEKFKMAMNSYLNYILAELNYQCLPKFQQFYKNWPKNLVFTLNESKEWTIPEIVDLAPVLQTNGLKLKPEFFEMLGLGSEYLEDAPEPMPMIQNDNNPENIDNKKGKKGFFSDLFTSKKKSSLNT
jgi:hypothetical protein